MKLLIIRHAKAEGFAMNDSARVLTEKGKDQAKRVGELLKRQGLVPDITLASPYARAKETAEIFCESSGAEPPVIEPWLACGMSPTLAMEELQAYSNFETVAICGHNPDFSYLAEALLGSQTGGIHVCKASIIVFDEVRPPSKSGYLEMILPPTVF
ncbi:phosphoglycerate mutase [Oceaniferula spumae]|uniref:Phosphoglycerate mutase n=1 Tax=Oceaniferula spumae TaxID=2979115 RepID=A0AAT9FSG3_9BACT